MARLAIYDRGAGEGAVTPPSLGSPRGDGGATRHFDAANKTGDGAGVDVYRELQELRDVWHEDKRELDKVCVCVCGLPACMCAVEQWGFVVPLCLPPSFSSRLICGSNINEENQINRFRIYIKTDT
eukprot:scaffold223095_cov18-Prasinocladus_malaysianus.AAC.1